MMRPTTLALAAALPLVLLVALDATSSFAHGKRVKGTLDGYNESPSISTAASGEFKAKISQDETSIEYTLSYSGLEGDVRQAHIHFAQPGVNGAIMVFLCQTSSSPDPTGLAPTCPQDGAVSGTLTAANMITPGATTQGIAPDEFAKMVAAIRAGATYANVHSTLFQSGEIRAQLK